MTFGRFARNAQPAPMSDINMTPLIDVMLVLLVIFMITAPLMASSLKLDLPRADGTTTSADTPAVIAVALDPQGQLYFGDDRLDPATFAARLGEAAKKNPNAEVQLRADKAVPYGRVAELIDVLQKAGLNRIGFVTDPASVRP